MSALDRFVCILWSGTRDHDNSVGFPAPRHHQLCRHRHLSIHTARDPAGSRSSSLVLVGRGREESQKKARGEASDETIVFSPHSRRRWYWASRGSTIHSRSSPFCFQKHSRLSDGDGVLTLVGSIRLLPSLVHGRMGSSTTPNISINDYGDALTDVSNGQRVVAAVIPGDAAIVVRQVNAVGGRAIAAPVQRSTSVACVACLVRQTCSKLDMARFLVLPVVICSCRLLI